MTYYTPSAINGMHMTVNRECALHILSIIVISTFERQRAGMAEAPDAVI